MGKVGSAEVLWTEPVSERSWGSIQGQKPVRRPRAPLSPFRHSIRSLDRSHGVQPHLPAGKCTPKTGAPPSLTHWILQPSSFLSLGIL